MRTHGGDLFLGGNVNLIRRRRCDFIAAGPSSSLDNGSIYGDGDDTSIAMIAIVENAKSRIRVQKRGNEHEEQGNSSS